MTAEITIVANPDPRFGFPIGDWHEWFAWRPVVTYDGRPAWLRTVIRRRIQKNSGLDGGADQWWQYQRWDRYVRP